MEDVKHRTIKIVYVNFNFSFYFNINLKLSNGSGPLKFDTVTGPFLKFDMPHGDLSDMRQGLFLKLACDMGP